jgi:hypothetical protein
MCESLRWQEWELLKDEERRKDEEPRVREVVHEHETEEPEFEPEHDAERELVRA